jgi:LysR family transcriptional regulator, hydrogen peroxide-inducible genes activator
VVLFERGSTEVSVTPLGEHIVQQARKVLEEAAKVKELAKGGKDPLQGALKVGVIYTIGPYLLPKLVPAIMKAAPQMPLLLQENFTVKLVELLREGEIDCAIMALPLPEAGLMMQPVYDEPFMVAVPAGHAWEGRKQVSAQELKNETMLMLGVGHCFRDQVLEVCPEMARFAPSADGVQRSFEGSSLETIRHMVASGIGITVLPMSSVPEKPSKRDLLRYVPFTKPVPDRRVVLAWRKTFTRPEAIEAVRQAVLACNLPGTQALPDAKAVAQ